MARRYRYIQTQGILLIIVVSLATVKSDENLALYKTATQSSDSKPSRWLADAAVDGCEQTHIRSNCCTHTAPDQMTAWWRVDLGQISTINTINIIYRDNFQERLAGYKLYVSNTTSSPQNGDLCYEDTSSILAAVQLNKIQQCPYVGRYVTVYNYRNDPKRYSWYSDNAVLELCEVKVNACPAGSYGTDDCSQVCPASCYGGNCDPKTGSCLYCAPGNYGDVCENTCSTYCKDRLCSKDTGHCIECIPGKFDDTCDQVCSLYCNTTVCDKDTGHCFGCTDGRYGDNCETDCPVNCKDRLCDRNTGYCTECISGTFGYTCNQECPDYCNGTSCFEGRRNVLWQVYHFGCTTGRYGTTCSFMCPVTCKDFVCDYQTGQCLDCYPGKYGVVCGADCPDSCAENICNKEDGHCLIQDSSQTEQSPVDTYIIIIAVLAVVCGLLAAALITAIIVICLLRNKDNGKSTPNKTTEQSSPDTGYTSLDRRDLEPAHVY
ncbi:scavenger receptor class F member 1-like [Argopecten irradians]|uniref:scavenger receptor class F member 1-like n=1 Tax=Argopecten irradians TaxID=31199 RepID=UPI00371687E9